jgi:hypothetical protein
MPGRAALVAAHSHFLLEYIMRTRASALALAVCAAISSPAWAVDFSYSGFSTAGYAQSDTDDAQVGYIGQPEGIDSDGTFAIDSKLGMQIGAKFNDYVSATVQGVAYADLTSEWKPHLDWAYVRVQPLSNVSARVGYMRAPTFMYSDSVFIGYANSWVRPPLEVYNLSPAYQLRGVDATWRGSVGPFAVSVNPYYGDSKLDVSDPAYTVEINHWAGLAASADYKSFMTRVGYAEVELGTTTRDVVPLVNGLNSVPAALCGNCAAIAEHLDLNGTTIKLADVGVQYDDGANLAIVEYASRSSGNYVLTDMYGTYATYGRRFGGFMPYVTYAIARRQEVMTTSVNAVGPVAALGAMLSANVNTVLSRANDDQDSYSIGVRYEVPSFAMVRAALVKLQFDHIDTKDGVGMLNSVQPQYDGTVDMISASFDFIF